MKNTKTAEEIEIMRKGGKILVDVVNQVKNMVKPGVSTSTLNDTAERIIAEKEARPSFLNYQGFPASICTSINEEVVHGIPSKRKLKEGDILSIDIGVFYKGLHVDTAITVPVGKISQEDEKLIKTTEESLFAGLAAVKAGNRVGDIASRTQQTAEINGFSVVRDMTGHGVGKELHEDPSIPNFGDAGTGDILEEGQTLAIEPMVNFGNWNVITCQDGWTVKTEDGKKSAHFEVTVLVKRSGYENLTPVHAF